ncbi:MAG: hypothetical protein JEZ04_04360 [Spirochaetales bacterium]|nr:hypothetical protein [Spirochaetales bacterium]
MMIEHKENSNFLQNTAGISIVEFFWGMGLPLVLESTFLQLFLKDLGATSFMIAFVPGIAFASQALFGLVSAYWTKPLARKRPAVIKFHLYPALAILLFGLFLLLSNGEHSSTLAVFFILYSVFSIGIGMTLPVWQNYFVKLFKPAQLLPAVAIMMIAQSAGRLICSFFIADYFHSRSITPSNSALLFIFCGLLFFFGSFAFLLTKEEESKADTQIDRQGFGSFIRQAFKSTLGDKNLMLFLLSDIELYAVIAVMSFYANYAVVYHNISPAAAAGFFVGFNYAGQITTNIIFGSFNLFQLKTKCVISRICSIGAVILLVTGTGLPVFLGASVLLGFSKAIRSLIYAPAVKIISGASDTTSIFAAASIILLPLSMGISLLSGKLLDTLSFLTADSYRIVFGIMGLLSFISIFFIIRIDFTRRSSTGV